MEEYGTKGSANNNATCDFEAEMTEKEVLQLELTSVNTNARGSKSAMNQNVNAMQISPSSGCLSSKRYHPSRLIFHNLSFLLLNQPSLRCLCYTGHSKPSEILKVAIVLSLWI